MKKKLGVGEWGRCLGWLAPHSDILPSMAPPSEKKVSFGWVKLKSGIILRLEVFYHNEIIAHIIGE